VGGAGGFVAISEPKCDTKFGVFRMASNMLL